MKPDEIEPLLSAYLDDELAEADRSEVESALVSQPELACLYESLKQTRDLVSALSRPPAPRTFAETLMQVANLRLRARRRAIRFSVITTAIAASLVVAVTLRVRPVVNAPVPVAMIASSDVATSNPTAIASEIPDPLPIAPALALSSPVASGIDVEAERLRMKQESDRQNIRSLLERADVRRILVVTDVLGEPASRIDRLISETPRNYSHFGRTTVSQGLVIDPDHPGEAIVFTLILTDRELNFLKDKLSSFAEVSQDSPPPEVTTQIAEVGNVIILPGIQPAHLEPIGPENQVATALRVETAPEVSKEPTAAQNNSGPHPSNRTLFPVVTAVAEKAAPVQRPEKTSAPHAVLVWVVTPTKPKGS